jgi:hypothetical protein
MDRDAIRGAFVADFCGALCDYAASRTGIRCPYNQLVVMAGPLAASYARETSYGLDRFAGIHVRDRKMDELLAFLQSFHAPPFDAADIPAELGDYLVVCNGDGRVEIPCASFLVPEDIEATAAVIGATHDAIGHNDFGRGAVIAAQSPLLDGVYVGVLMSRMGAVVPYVNVEGRPAIFEEFVYRPDYGVADREASPARRQQAAQRPAGLGELQHPPAASAWLQPAAV